MENKIEKNDTKTVLSLSNITQITAFAVAIAVVFSLIRLYVYYVILLHIPIFQYVEFLDIVLLAPTAIFWVLYMGTSQVSSYIISSRQFQVYERIFYPILLYSFLIFIIYVGYRNDPIIEQIIRMPFRYFWYGLVPFAIITLVIVQSNKSGQGFLKRNIYIASIVAAIWFAVFESFANFEALSKSSNPLHYIIKTKHGVTIRTGQDLIYAGRTKDYWFIYNLKSGFVRAVRNDEIEVIDFDTKTK